MGMFNLYEAQEKADQPIDIGMQYANLPRGRVGVAVAGQGGAMMGGGAMQGMGFKTPAQQRNDNIMKVREMFPNPTTDADFREIGNMFNNIGEPDLAEQAFDQIKDTGTSKDTMTTAMKDIRDIAKYQLGCDFNDPECAKKSNQLYIDRKRKTAGEIGEGEFSKGQSKILNDAEKKIYDDADEANYQIATIDQSMKMLDDIYTGAGGDWLSYGKNIAASFGFAEADWAAGEEMFKVNTMKSVMAWIKQTKGAISEKEMKLFAEAAPGLSRTRAGNRLILNTMREAAIYQRRLESEYGKWVDANTTPNGKFKGSIRKWRSHKRNWVLTNGIKMPTKSQINAALKGTTAPPPVSGSATGAITIEVVE